MKLKMLNMKLKTLEESNAEAFKNNTNQQKWMYGEPTKNGIACPVCTAELYDSSPMLTLPSSPAQKYIHCNNCEFKGTRYL